MPSAIDATKPADGIAAVKADLRDNLSSAKSEIEALQTRATVVNDAAVPAGLVDNETVLHIGRGAHLVHDSASTADGLSVFSIGGEVWRKIGNGNGIIQPEQIGLAQGIDVTTQLQDFANALSGGTDLGNQTLLLPFCDSSANAMTIASTITFNASYFQIVGRGEQSSHIRWTGAAGADMFLLRQTRGPILENFFLEGSVANRPRSAIRIHKDASGGASPRRGICRHLRIGGPAFDMFDNNVIFSCADGFDQNNEQWHFYGCLMQNAINSSYWFGHLNSLWHKIFGGACENFRGSAFNTRDIWDNGSGPVSDTAGAPSLVAGVSMTSFAADVLTSDTAFRMGSTAHPFAVIGCDLESVGKILEQSGGGRASFSGISAKVGTHAFTGPQIHLDNAAGVKANVVFRDSTIIASDGVSIEVTGDASVLSLAGLSGNPSKLTANDGGTINIEGHTHNSDSGGRISTYATTNDGIINYDGPPRNASRTVQVDNTLDCSFLDFIAVQFGGNDLNTINIDNRLRGQSIKLLFSSAGNIVSGGNILGFNGAVTIDQTMTLTRSISNPEKWHVS